MRWPRRAVAVVVAEEGDSAAVVAAVLRIGVVEEEVEDLRIEEAELADIKAEAVALKVAATAALRIGAADLSKAAAILIRVADLLTAAGTRAAARRGATLAATAIEFGTGAVTAATTVEIGIHTLRGEEEGRVRREITTGIPAVMAEIIMYRIITTTIIDIAIGIADLGTVGGRDRPCIDLTDGIGAADGALAGDSTWVLWAWAFLAVRPGLGATTTIGIRTGCRRFAA